MLRDPSPLRRPRAHALTVALASLGLIAAAQGIAFAQAPAPAPAASAVTQAAPTQDQAQPVAGDAAAAPGDSAAAPTDAAAPVEGASTEPQADTRGLDEEVQGLKKDVVDLNKDLFVLEEELLFPANTQVAVFVSMDVGDFFALDNVTLKIDQKEVTNYLYTPREAEALLKGGVQRLYLGNLKVGDHELVAFFTGKGPNERDYKRGATLRFEKGIGAKYLELKINDRQKKQQPEFEIKDWE
ncbi:MAG: AraC family transcriptional regulator [Gammaproteobacteria bacterium]